MLYSFLAEQIIDFRPFGLAFFQSIEERSGIDIPYVWGNWFDVVFDHVNAAKITVPHISKFGKGIQNFLTVSNLLATNMGVVWPVCILLNCFHTLGFFVSVHLVSS